MEVLIFGAPAILVAVAVVAFSIMMVWGKIG